MDELSAKELDLIERIQKSPELRTLFFRRVKGLKWFNVLHELGYFSAEKIPPPNPAKEEGYTNIPRWEALEYLVKTVPELTNEVASEYVPLFMKIITDATSYAEEQGFGNYHVWWKFSEILSQIPSKFLTPGCLDIVAYWLDDKYDRGIVSEVVGEKWLFSLLEEGNENALLLARKLLEILFRIEFVEKDPAGRRSREAHLKFEYYHAEKITKKTAFLAGCRLRQEAVSVFHSKLEEIFKKLENDSWSSLWQPAIEDHEQNKYHDDAENVLLIAYRDSLEGYMKAQPEEACEYLAALLENPYQTIERLAIYTVGQNFQRCKHLCDRLINEKYLQSNYRHEMWHFLSQNYGDFADAQKANTRAIIEANVRTDEDGNVLEGASAYERSIWLAAIKDYGQVELDLYQEATKVAKTEPDHPDFSSYMSVGWGGQKSPYSMEELSSLSVDDLIQTLTTCRGGGGWGEPGIEGLSKEFKQLIRNTPLKFCDQLGSFTDLDLAYVYAIIEAYRELWGENVNLPWDDVWQYLLSYISGILKQDRFWDPANAEQRQEHVANRYWIVSSIGRLLEAGSKSDDHAFHEKFHDEAESILALLLEKESGAEFKEDGDAVSIAINSPRGRCIEALINLSLRVCRLEDGRNNRGHTAAWDHFRHYYDAELERPEYGEYEFATLVTNYLPNFRYMSKEWVP